MTPFTNDNAKHKDMWYGPLTIRVRYEHGKHIVYKTACVDFSDIQSISNNNKYEAVEEIEQSWY